MSLAIEKIPLSQSYDPRVGIPALPKSYNVHKGSDNTTLRFHTSTSYNINNIQWAIIPPSPIHLISPRIQVKMYVQLVFTGTSTSGNLLQIGSNDAVRGNSLNSKFIQQLVIQMNNGQTSMNSSDFVQALLRYYNDGDSKFRHNSMSPSMLDQSQEYSQLTGGIRNPLGAYVDGIDGVWEPRGGFPMTVVSNTPTAATVQFAITEDLYIPPLAYGKDSMSRGGFSNIQTLNFNMSLNDPSNLWSHSTSGNTITGIVGTFYAAPQLNMVFLTRNPLLSYPKQWISPYFEFQRYPSPVVTLASGASTTIASNNIQLQSIPSLVWLFVRQQNSDLQAVPSVSTQGGVIQTDTFMNITNLQVQWGNRNSLLGSADETQLYQMSVENGLNLSWTQWKQNVGSVVCFSPPNDLGLPPAEAPGLLTTLQLQVNVTCNNPGPNSKNVVLYMVVMQEGTISTFEGEVRTVLNLNVVSREDVIASYNAPLLPPILNEKYFGGSFFSKVGNFLSKAKDYVKDNKLLSRGLSLIPGLPAKAASAAADALGYGMKRRRVRRRRMRGGALEDEDEDNEDEEYSDDEITLTSGGQSITKKGTPTIGAALAKALKK